MVIEIQHRICNGTLLKWLASAGLVSLDHHHQLVNQNNVFPVPDGDTGTNMMLTMQKACAGLANLDEEHVGIVADAIANGALMGARGNSGVILSQLWRGFADALKGREFFDAPLFAFGCRSAVDRAYKAVVTPVEGTILTVAREACETVAARSRTDTDLRVLLQAMVDTARVSLKNTPNLLPMLKEAGVVDSGGMGLVFMLEGMLRFIRGEEMEFSAQEVSANGQHWQETLVPKSEEGYGYDVQFLMHGTGMNVAAVRDAINSMGWSTLVVGDDGLIKVHVHVHDPGKPISYAIGLGAMLDDVVVENLHQQYRQYVEERIARETDIGKPPAGVAVIAVASGDGLRRLFTEELHAAKIISGGQTMNPSTEDFLTAMDALPNQDIILLPNNKNIVLATRQAAALSRGKNVHVVPSCTLPQGIAAMVAYTSLYETGTLDEIDAAMQDAINHVMSVEITTAVRDSKFDTLHVRTGQVIGLLDGKLVAAGNTLAEVVHMVLRIAHAEQHELITLYYGSDVSADDAQSLADALTVDFSKQEFIVIQGEQPLYPYLISVE